MFLLVSGCPDGHQHCISIQSSVYLGESFLLASDLNLGKELRIFVSFHFPDSSLSIEQF